MMEGSRLVFSSPFFRRLILTRHLVPSASARCRTKAFQRFAHATPVHSRARASAVTLPIRVAAQHQNRTHNKYTSLARRRSVLQTELFLSDQLTDCRCIKPQTERRFFFVFFPASRCVNLLTSSAHVLLWPLFFLAAGH